MTGESKKNNVITTLILLCLAALISSAVTLTLVLPKTGDEDADVVIDAGSGDKVITINTRESENSSDTEAEGSAAGNAAAAYAAEHPGLKVKDESGTIWTSREKDVDIFEARYLGEDGYSVTVESSDGSGVIAPGTGNSYDFDVKNTGKGTLGYYVVVKTKTSGSVYIPLDIRLREGNRYIEDEKNLPLKNGWYNFDEVPRLYDEGSLGVKEKTTYTIDWVWPYGSAWKDIDHDLKGADKVSTDQDSRAAALNGIHDTNNTENTTAQDEWDTMLGSMELRKDLTVRVNISVVAWSKYDGGTGSVGVKTGDYSLIIIWIIVFVSVLLVLLLLCLLIRRRRKNDAAAEITEAVITENEREGQTADMEKDGYDAPDK